MGSLLPGRMPLNPLSKVALGKTNVHVTRLGLGGSALGGLYQDISDETAIALVHRVLELGINFIDTAPLYGHGRSELRLGSALKGAARASCVLATKVGRLLIPEHSAKVETSGSIILLLFFRCLTSATTVSGGRSRRA